MYEKTDIGHEMKDLRKEMQVLRIRGQTTDRVVDLQEENRYLLFFCTLSLAFFLER